MKGVIGAPSRGGRPMVAPKSRQGSRSTVHPESKGLPVDDVFLSARLHQIVCAAYPQRTLVDTIPDTYSRMHGEPFPITAEQIPPGRPDGLAHVLGTRFGSILKLSQNNRDGKIFSEPILAVNMSLDDVMRVQAKYMQHDPATPSQQGSVAPIASISTPSQETLELFAKGVHRLLIKNAKIGEAENLDALKMQIHGGFFELFKIPLAIETPLDPLVVIQQAGGSMFGRLIEEPVTGRVSVSAVVSSKPTALVKPIITKTTPAVEKIPDTIITVLTRQLRTQLLQNLDIVDKALSGGQLDVPDESLWKNALETLINQQVQASDILNNLFSSK